MIISYTRSTYTDSLFLWHINLILVLGEQLRVAGSATTCGKSSREELLILTMEAAIPVHTEIHVEVIS